MTTRARARLLALPIPVLALLLCSMGQGAATGKPATHTVTIEGMEFKASDLTVKAGDSIVWVNKDMFPHTVTSTANAFDSHSIEPGKSWTFRAATKGEFPYACALHPTMRGTLRVK
jgi:plastocyanin